MQNYIINNGIINELEFIDNTDYNLQGALVQNSSYKTVSLNSKNKYYKLIFKTNNNMFSGSTTHFRVNAFNINEDEEEVFKKCIYAGIFDKDGSTYTMYETNKIYEIDVNSAMYDIIKISLSKNNFNFLSIIQYEPEFNHHTVCALEPGGVITNSTLLYNSTSYSRIRSQKMIKVTPNSIAYLKLSNFTIDTLEKIISVNIICIGNNLKVLNKNTYDINFYNNFTDNMYFNIDNDVYYIYIWISFGDNKSYDYGDVEIHSTKSVHTVYRPNIPNNSADDNLYPSIGTCYEVSRGILTSGRLMLPPNYSIEGNPVPLIVFVHGSGGMLNWNSPLGYASGGDYRPYLDYLTKEGFAVFDCYPWTNRYSISSDVYSPFIAPNIINSYLEGIKYFCSRYNIDINRTSLICKSQGGHIGNWALSQTLFNFKAIAMFAPSNSTGSFFNTNARSAILKYVDFVGSDEEIQEYITSGNANTDTLKPFIERNKNIIVHMMPFAQGVIGSNIDELYYIGTTTVSTVPQWMIDSGIPIKYDDNGNPKPYASALFRYCVRDDLIKISHYPVKYWCAFDDAQTSSYCNYATYKWLINGGCEAYFRELPLGTGGHHAMDTGGGDGAEALTTSGVTRLGIEYTDIPLAYVEVVEFIENHNGG